MNSVIKKFIEENITLIESNEWKHVFLNWYILSYDIWPDTEKFIEFLEILSDAGVEPYMEDRQAVLFDTLVYYMEQLKMDKFNEHHHVGRFSLLNKLNSTLGYTEKEVHKIMDEAAEKLGLQYTNYYGGGYTW